MQKTANCVIGRDYPAPMVDHKTASQHNSRNMEELQKLLLSRCNIFSSSFKSIFSFLFSFRCNMEEPSHVKPSDENEVRKFFNIDPSEELRPRQA